ncbi:hypothetical protein ACHAXR_004154 [Thalassiosira sp. AJA248-18]
MHFLLNRVHCHIVTRTEDQKSFEVKDAFGGTATYINKIIYESYPHGTADNHFSGEHVMDFAGRQGFGLTVTNRRDRFPKGTKPYFHHDKTVPGCKNTKAARYEKPIVAIKQVPATDSALAYTKTQVSFQSTGATNIQGVNNLPSCSLYVTTKSRGIGPNKRVWGIEQNEGRGIYLGQYWAIDSVDHMIMIAMVRYITWKYWHAPYLHCLSMAITAAYDMYIECCEGKLDRNWYIPEKSRMSNSNFRLTLSEQMLNYDPKDNKYPGDSKMREFTRRRKRDRDNMARKSTSTYVPDGLTIRNFKKAKAGTRHKPPRLCGDLDDLKQHLASCARTNNSGKCEVCGAKTTWTCKLCDKKMCVLEEKKFKGIACALSYHNDNFFGLTRSDFKCLYGSKMGDWVPPSQNKIKSNARRIETIKRAVDEDDDESE